MRFTLSFHRPLFGQSFLSLICVTGLSVLWGCSGGDGYAPVTQEAVQNAEAHVHDDHGHHAHAAPHGGHLIELGDHQYNAEIVLEADDGRLVVYVLDAHAENAVAITQEQIELAMEGGETISLAAEAQDGDPEGQASRFVATGEAVVAIKDIEELHGSVTLEIEGNSYTGAIAHDHDGHDHHGHEHGEDADHHQHGDDDEDAPAPTEGNAE